MKVAVLGVGLIGGSIGLAARGRAGACVSGYDPDSGVLANDLERGATDEPAPDDAEAETAGEAVFADEPVGALPETVLHALELAGPSRGRRRRLDR